MLCQRILIVPLDALGTKHKHFTLLTFIGYSNNAFVPAFSGRRRATCSRGTLDDGFLEQIATIVNDCSDRLGKRFGRLDEHFGNMDKHFDSLETSVNSMNYARIRQEAEILFGESYMSRISWCAPFVILWS